VTANNEPGAFVISLDFEIMWGVCDKPDIRSYYLDNLLGVRRVIPSLLDMFTQYGIRASFATVGMLFAGTRDELQRHLPELKPQYNNKLLSPYIHEIDAVGENENTDPFHYASSLINMIAQTPGQEVGCHTFCHYYCLEDGQTIAAFEADIDAALRIAANKSITLKSLVFPRNQFNDSYLEVLRKFGFTSYRGNEQSWMYQARNRQDEKLFRRMCRLADSYVNLSGHHIYHWDSFKGKGPLFNIPASRFLRPYNRKLKRLEGLRLKRILNDMTTAAKQKAIYHVWWHPHNFGVQLEENLEFLRRILTHYQDLQQKYAFESLTMSEVATKLSQREHAA
jgi:peptidoglycan/xylan/chitin deacetylase (PgdA/CDA1 family)